MTRTPFVATEASQGQGEAFPGPVRASEPDRLARARGDACGLDKEA